MRHLTQNTPKDRSNFAPIFSRDGKFLVYTQASCRQSRLEHLPGRPGQRQSINLTPHQGEQNYFASDISPDGKTLLHHLERAERIRECRIARYRDAENRLADERQMAHQRWRVLARWQIFDLDGQCRWQCRTLSLQPGIETGAGAASSRTGVNSLGGKPRRPIVAMVRNFCYYHNGANAPERRVGLRPGIEAVRSK